MLYVSLRLCLLLWLLAGGWLIILCVKGVLAQSDCCSSVAPLFSRSPQAKWDVVGRKKGSKPSISLPSSQPPISQLPSLPSFLRSSIPDSLGNPEPDCEEQRVPPWMICLLEPSPVLMQDSSQCQYDLMNISLFYFPPPALFGSFLSFAFRCSSSMERRDRISQHRIA